MKYSGALRTADVSKYKLDEGFLARVLLETHNVLQSLKGSTRVNSGRGSAMKWGFNRRFSSVVLFMAFVWAGSALAAEYREFKNREGKTILFPIYLFHGSGHSL